MNKPLKFIGDCVIQRAPLLEVSNKVLLPKRWMKKTCYFHRVQKKWDRRYGVSFVEAIPEGQVIHDQVNRVIYVRTDDYEKIRKEIDCENRYQTAGVY